MTIAEGSDRNPVVAEFDTTAAQVQTDSPRVELGDRRAPEIEKPAQLDGLGGSAGYRRANQRRADGTG